MTGELPKGQAWILQCIADPRRGNGNWAGTSQESRRALVKKGLIENVSRAGPDYHGQNARYRVTELGLQVVCAMKFDEDLKYGYAAWVAELDRAFARDWQEALQDNERWNVEHGLRYQPLPEVEADVRRTLWKHVKVVP